MIIVAIAIVIIVLAATGVIKASSEFMTIVIIVGVIAFFLAGVSESRKDAEAYYNRREYWRKRGSGPYDQRITKRRK